MSNDKNINKSTLRYLISRRHTNGMKKFLIKVGRRSYVDEEKIKHLLEKQPEDT